MEKLVNSTHTHAQETKVALVVLILASIGFAFFSMSAAPVEKHGGNLATH
jgi:hypothetical protein